MPTTTPSRLGQANLTGDDDALFYKVFANEVLATFNRETVTLDKHRVRNLTNAKSAGFNVIGSATAGYHTVGTNILDPANGLLNQIAHAFYHMRNYECLRYFGETYLSLFERTHRLDKKLDHKKLKALEVLHPAKFICREWKKRREY